MKVGPRVHTRSVLTPSPLLRKKDGSLDGAPFIAFHQFFDAHELGGLDLQKKK